MPDRALVIIPTYNEIANLPQIVPAVLLQDPRLEILVVDDNSPDGTGRLADDLASHEPRVHVLHRMSKDGLGRAYIAGFQWALQHDYDFIFEMDADFSHDPKFLPDFLVQIQNADLVLGSRYKQGVNVINWPISRLLLSLGANAYARWISGLPLSDATGGFKCFRRKVLEAIDLESVRSNGDLDGLVAAAAGNVGEDLGKERHFGPFLQDDRLRERFRHARRPGAPARHLAGHPHRCGVCPADRGGGRRPGHPHARRLRPRGHAVLQRRRLPCRHVWQRRPLHHAPGCAPWPGVRFRDDPPHSGR